MMHLGMLVVTPGQRGPILEQGAAPYGATAITGPEGHRGLSVEEEEEARDLGQRIAEVAAWLERRYERGGKIDWHFSTEDARIKLKRLYPSVQE